MVPLGLPPYNTIYKSINTNNGFYTNLIIASYSYLISGTNFSN